MNNSTKKGAPATATPSNSDAHKCTGCTCEPQAAKRRETWLRFAIAAFPALITEGEKTPVKNYCAWAALLTAEYANAMMKQIEAQGMEQ